MPPPTPHQAGNALNLLITTFLDRLFARLHAADGANPPAYSPPRGRPRFRAASGSSSSEEVPDAEELAREDERAGVEESESEWEFRPAFRRPTGEERRGGRGRGAYGGSVRGGLSGRGEPYPVLRGRGRAYSGLRGRGGFRGRGGWRGRGLERRDRAPSRRREGEEASSGEEAPAPARAGETTALTLMDLALPLSVAVPVLLAVLALGYVIGASRRV